MILEKQTENLVLEDGEVQQSTDMMLDLDSATFLMQMLSKFYSDGIGSLIRETASNALDSHRSVGTKDPIIVSLTQGKDGNYEFSVEDFGLGIGADTVENVIKKYGKSTKRKESNQLGAFGQLGRI
jgi:sensor histidine kinase regulating citrate/malate metabolism